MRISNGSRAINAYGGSKAQHEALIARSSRSGEEQLRIAKNSDNRLVLANLALNRNLEAAVVQELFDRDLSYVTSRLENLGHKNKSWF